MSPRKHQVLVYGPAAALDGLKARLNPYYAVHAVTYASLSGDPWEDQCAALVLVEEETPRQWGTRVRERVQTYLAEGGKVVQSVTREGAVRDVLAMDVGLGDVNVQRSAERSLALDVAESSPLKPLGTHNTESGIRAAKMSVPRSGSGLFILTTLSAHELSEPSETAAVILQACHIEIPHHPLAERPSSRIVSDETIPPRRDGWSSLPPELLKPTRPLPQLMLVNPDLGRDSLGWDIWSAQAQGSLTEEERTRIVLEDMNDTLQIEKLSPDEAEAATRTVESARPDSRASPLEDFAREKTILCPHTLRDAMPAMPLFQAEAYFAELVRLGRLHGQRKPKASGESQDGWNIGDVVLYGEAVTSTQTMLDKNPQILRGLATPFLSLATFQLSGRGRGSNQWLSPPGCLQFSLLLTLPPQFPADKLVFIQYLAALAICDGLDADGRLGVRIKWPNDIYAHAEGVGGTTIGSGERGKAKLGGILVNSSLVDGQWRVVVGCGINVLNDLPTTSLAQLHDVKARRDALRHGRAGSEAQAESQVTMEASLARILVSFEGFWTTFLQDQGFKGLLDEYLGRWLHSDQKVTLTSVTPHQALVIKTITLDYGLLRCIPDRSADSALPRSSMYDGGSEDRSFGFRHSLSAGMRSLGIDRAQSESYVDLQPDGNSFDLMSGLIKRKV